MEIFSSQPEEISENLDIFIMAVQNFVAEYAKGNKSGAHAGKTYGHIYEVSEKSETFQRHQKNLQTTFKNVSKEDRDINFIKYLVLKEYKKNPVLLAKYDIASVERKIDKALAVAAAENKTFPCAADEHCAAVRTISAERPPEGKDLAMLLAGAIPWG